MSRNIFIDKVLSFARREKLWKKGDRILAGVSGGPDSLALLLFLKEVETGEGIQVGCCIVNHHLREAAEGETAYVQKVCHEFGIPFYRRDVDVNGARKAGKGSVETVARELRYHALGDVMEKEGYSHLAVAHHENDQAETVLFRLLRGSGLKGLSGMKPKRDGIIRPFLCVTRKEIGDFLKAYPVTPCHDETNDIPDTARNKIRLLLMPNLLSYNPELVPTLARMAESFRGDDAYMEEQVSAEKVYFGRSGSVLSYPLNRFREIHPALERRILISAVEETGGKTPDFDCVERMQKMAQKGTAGKKTSGAGVVMEVQTDRICFYEGSTRKKSRESGEDAWRLLLKKWGKEESPGLHTIGIIKRSTILSMESGAWELEMDYLDRPVKTGRNQYLLDGDKIGALYLRRADKRDRLEPLGMEGSKSVFSILQEKGIAPVLRKEWPVAADGSHVYWVAFLRGSRLAQVDEHTTSYVLLTLRWKNKESQGE